MTRARDLADSADKDIAGTLTVDSFAATDGSTITVNDNSVALELICTDTDASQGPILRLSRNVAGAASDVIGTLHYYGQDVAGNDTQYAEIEGRIQDATNGAEDGTLVLSTMVAGTSRSRLNFYSTEAVFNDGSQDINFRVESNGNANMLFVDGGNDRVSIGHATPDGLLHLKNSDSTAYSATATDGQVGVGPTIYLENPSNSNTTVGGQIVFGMRSTEEQARIGATGGTAPALTFGTGDVERMRLTSSGRLGLGTQSPEALLDVAYSLPVGTNGIIRPLKLRTTDTANQTNLQAGDGVGILFEIPDQSSGSIGASIDAVKESGTDDDTLTSLVFKTSANNETLREVMRLHSGGRVSVGLNDSDTTFGSFQVNQQTNNDESGIAIMDSTDARSMRLWCGGSVAYINSGDGGGATLHLNQGAGGVRMGVHNNFEMKTDPSSTNAVVYIRSGESYNSGVSTDLGTGTVMMQIEGDSDTLQVRNINSGDYAIVNSQQKNGIAFYDGTGGLGFYYGNSEKAEVTNAGFQTVSDERLKDNQGEMDIDAISVFNNLDLFKYHPKATPDDDNVDTDTLMYGFSAQQLHALAPVSVGAGVDDLSTDPKKPWYSVNDTSIKAMMIQAIKALSSENASLVARIEALEAQATTP